MRFPIVFFDVDGTLLNSAKQVSPLTLRALEALHDTGVKLCIATGRPVKSARLAMQHHHIDHLLSGYVCNNGIEIVNIVHQTYLTRHHLNKSDVVRLLNHVKHLNANAMIYGPHHCYALAMDDTIARIALQNQLEPVITNLYELDFETTPKVLIIVNETTSPRIQAFMHDNPLPGLQSFISQADLYEFVSAHAGKGKGVLTLAEQFGYHADSILAYGDAQNDLEMIALVGHGVAMGNADEQLKDIAQEVCLSNDEDGIAYSLKHHFNLEF